MNYDEALEYLLNKLPMYQRVGAPAIKKDLTNIQALCEVLGNPQEQFTSIHIAGTNGKGSVNHILSSILMEAGYKTGYHTSPHLTSYRERIVINGQKVPEDYVVDFINRNYEAIESIQPSFFEVSVAMAWDYFAQESVDIAVTETGLGGRLDSTNLLNPVLTVITNVSLDHQHMLGNDRQTIAREKAGIIKPKTPVIIGEKDEETKGVFAEIAQWRSGPYYFAEDMYNYQLQNFDNGTLTLDFYDNHAHLVYEDLSCDLTGFYQADNIRTALASIDQLKQQKFEIEEAVIRNGLQKVKQNTGLKGRWEKLADHPLTICDIAHNQAAIQWHKKQLGHYNYKQLYVVLGMTEEKKLDEILAELPSDAIYYFCKPDLPRGLDANKLKSEATIYGLKGYGYESVEEAVGASRQNANSEDLILITGSAFVVTEALGMF